MISILPFGDRQSISYIYHDGVGHLGLGSHPRLPGQVVCDIAVELVGLLGHGKRFVVALGAVVEVDRCAVHGWLVVVGSWGRHCSSGDISSEVATVMEVGTEIWRLWRLFITISRRPQQHLESDISAVSVWEGISRELILGTRSPLRRSSPSALLPCTRLIRNDQGGRIDISIICAQNDRRNRA